VKKRHRAGTGAETTFAYGVDAFYALTKVGEKRESRKKKKIRQKKLMGKGTTWKEEK